MLRPSEIFFGLIGGVCLVIAFVFLSSDIPDGPTLQERIIDDTEIVCIEGFQYIYGGYLRKGYMAPVFDKEDRLPKRCD